MNRQVSKNQSRGLGSLGMKLGAKRKAEGSPGKKDEPKKRSGLGDITNKSKMTLRSSLPKEDTTDEIKKSKLKTTTVQEKGPELPKLKAKTSLPKVYTAANESKIPKAKTTASLAKPDKVIEKSDEATTESDVTAYSTLPLTDLKEKDEESLLYSTAVQTPDPSETNVAALNQKNKQLTEKKLTAELAESVYNFDAECGNDPFQVGCYAADIFEYYKQRESKFAVKKYMENQSELNRNMRMILVDWMVEVQENFELNHETLYLGVKMVDLFLRKVQVSRDRLQLVGAAALYVAAKFDERTPPMVDDFCYICDDAYPNKDIIRMETKILKTLKFDIGMPVSYRFLRRYARCIQLEMSTLTFARYILETSLLEYDLVDARDSMMAAACLLLAMTLTGTKDAWTPALVHYTGYTLDDIFDLTHRVHNMLGKIPAQFKTIRTKYSHKLFYEAALIPIPDTFTL